MNSNKEFKLNNLPSPPQKYSSYKDLCNNLGLPILGGDSRKAQLKNLSRYLSYHREGNAYIIDKVYSTPQKVVEVRGKNKPLTEYQYLFNSLLLYDLVYGAKDNNIPVEGEGKDCVSYTRTDLKQKLFKLMNQDYYKARKDSNRAAQELGITERMLKFVDAKFTDKINSLSFRGFKQLQEECRINMGNGIYIYYIKINDYLGKGEKNIRCRIATPDERSLITAADWIGFQEYQKDYEDLGFEEKVDPETFRGRGKQLLKKKLKILNGTENIELIENEIFKIFYDQKEKRDTLEDLTEEEYNELVDTCAEDDRVQVNSPTPTQEWMEIMKKRDGLNRYALEKGEFWVNIVEKIQFFMPPQFTLMGMLKERKKKLQKMTTMPEAQEKLNQYVLKWGDESAETRWNTFGQKFLIENKTGSQDIPGDVKKFGRRYIDIHRVEKNYDWQIYKDENGKEWKVRFASNKMSFDVDNLGIYELQQDNSNGKEVILWNAPQKGMLCTNCRELMDLAREEWSRRGWMPIEGYLGGIWDEGEDREIGCVILNLGDEGSEFLKEAWENRAGAK